MVATAKADPLKSDDIAHVTYVKAHSIREWKFECSCGVESSPYHSRELCERLAQEHEKEGNKSKSHDWSQGEPLDLSAQEQRRKVRDREDRERAERINADQARGVQVKALSASGEDELARKVQEFLWANDLKIGEFYAQITWRDAQRGTAFIFFR